MPFNPEPHQGRRPYLPTFQEVMLTYEYEDSMRLPSYQARHLGRYHPYLRPSPRFDGPSSTTRYANTIYDEECVFLEVPSFAPAASRVPIHRTSLTKVHQFNAPVAAAVAPRVDTVHPTPANPLQGPVVARAEEEQQLGGVGANWFGGFIETFLQGVRRAIMAEAGADVVPLPEADLAAQPGDDFANETELDHALYGSVP